MNDLWLPEGAHWDLNIKHHRLEDSGPFTGGGWKLCHHTVEAPRDSIQSMIEVLAGKRAAPHLLYGYTRTSRFPFVYQMIPFNLAGRALQHTFGPETNRANCIQIEICGRAADSHRWSDNYYKGLANLCRMVERRVNIPRRAPKKFPDTRFSPQGWVNAKGHVGHIHCPGNDHTDPGPGFRIHDLFRFMEQAGNHGVNLKPVTR